MDDIFYSSRSGYNAPNYESYSGNHCNGKKIIKHTTTVDGISYYLISHPKKININTGNACFRLGDLKKYDKNFIFQYYDNNGKFRSIILGRKQLSLCKFVIHHWDKDEDGNPIKHHMCGGVKIADVFRYGRQLN